MSPDDDDLKIGFYALLPAVSSEGPTMSGAVKEPEPVCVARGRWGLEEA